MIVIDFKDIIGLCILGAFILTWDFEKDDWGTAEPSWSSAVMPSDRYYGTKEEAIAATVARLKEVCDAE